MNEQKGAHENIPLVFSPIGVQILSDELFPLIYGCSYSSGEKKYTVAQLMVKYYST